MEITNHKPLITRLQKWWERYETFEGIRYPKVLNVRAFITRDHILAEMEGKTFQQLYRERIKCKSHPITQHRKENIQLFIKAGYSQDEARFYTNWRLPHIWRISKDRSRIEYGVK